MEQRQKHLKLRTDVLKNLCLSVHVGSPDSLCFNAADLSVLVNTCKLSDNDVFCTTFCMGSIKLDDELNVLISV